MKYPIRPSITKTKKNMPLSLVQTIKLLKPSVVKIGISGIETATGNQTNSPDAGSGFLINDQGYAITNYHVIASVFGLNQAVITVYLATTDINSTQAKAIGNFMGVECQLVSYDANADLALLKLSTNPFVTRMVAFKIGDDESGVTPKVPKFVKRKIDDGDLIAASGYPLSMPSLITTSGCIAAAFLPDGNYHADMQLNPGNSGGPVYLVETGEIIGVVVSFKQTNSQSVYKRNEQTGQYEPVEYAVAYNSGISQVIGLDRVREFVGRIGLVLA